MAERTVYEIARAVAVKMRGYPVDVVYGADRLDEGPVTRNVIRFLETGSESIGPSMVARSGVRPVVGMRWRAVDVVIEGKANIGGAQEHDQKGAVDDLIEPFWCALISVTQARAQTIENGSAQGSFEDTPLEAGARYRLSLRLGSTLREVAFDSVEGSDLVPSGTTGVTVDGTTQSVCSP